MHHLVFQNPNVVCLRKRTYFFPVDKRTGDSNNPKSAELRRYVTVELE